MRNVSLGLYHIKINKGDNLVMALGLVAFVVANCFGDWLFAVLPYYGGNL